MSSYIENNLIDLRKLLNIVLTYKENIFNNQNFKSFNYKPNDLKGLKLCMLSTLFTENFDDLSSNVDENLKKLIINNGKIKRRNTPFNFENGGYFETGSGINIKSLPATFQTNDYSAILKMIRNGIAHSKYTYNNGIVRISTYQGQFEVDCDVDWLEMMVMCLFSNRQSTTQNGARDIQLDAFNSTEVNHYDLDDSQTYVSIISNGNDDSMLLYDKIASKSHYMKKLMENGVWIFRENSIRCIEEIYNKFNINVIKTERVNNVKNIVLGIQDEYRYNELSLEKKYFLFGSRIYAHYDEERKNTMAYKHMLNLLNVLKGSMDKQYKKINKVGTDFFVDYMCEYCFKCYINLVYNHINEKIGVNVGNIDANKFYIDIKDNRTFEDHIRNSCCHNRVKINGEYVCLWDEKNGILNFELKCKINDFIELTDDAIKNLSKTGAIKIDETNFKIKR